MVSAKKVILPTAAMAVAVNAQYDFILSSIGSNVQEGIISGATGIDAAQASSLVAPVLSKVLGDPVILSLFNAAAPQILNSNPPASVIALLSEAQAGLSAFRAEGTFPDITSSIKSIITNFDTAVALQRVSALNVQIISLLTRDAIAYSSTNSEVATAVNDAWAAIIAFASDIGFIGGAAAPTTSTGGAAATSATASGTTAASSAPPVVSSAAPVASGNGTAPPPPSGGKETVIAPPTTDTVTVIDCHGHNTTCAKTTAVVPPPLSSAPVVTTTLVTPPPSQSLTTYTTISSGVTVTVTQVCANSTVAPPVVKTTIPQVNGQSRNAVAFGVVVAAGAAFLL